MNVLTFDIEEWFHILDNRSTRSCLQWEGFESRIEANMPRLLDFLTGQGQKATFFCLGWIAEKHPAIVREIDGLGHEIGTHSHMHQLVYTQSREEFKTDLERSVKTLEDLTGKKVRSYRAPGFSITKQTPWAFDILRECGIEIDCSIFAARRAHGGYGDFSWRGPCRVNRGGETIKEFPLCPFDAGPFRIVFSGGGYFRIMPYGLIRLMMKRSDYAMVYLHYRDFDPGQRVLEDLPLHRRFKSYVGIKGAFRKLQKLLADFEFTDLRTAEGLVDWDNTPIVKT
jgi:polysaccharide deacetylase family protein (PEP-CTERM system associated)